MTTDFNPSSIFGGGANPFLDFLEEEPRAAFFSQQDRVGGSPNRQRLFQNQFSNFHNQFLGTLGAQIQQGQLPTARFGEFVKDIDFNQEFGSLPPDLSGRGFTSRFAPRTRSLFGFG